MMKKLMAVLVCGTIPYAAHAASVACDGTVANAANVDYATDGTKFVRKAFKAPCSNNSYVRYDQSSVALWGAAGSIKGKNIFIGASTGGSIRPSGADACGNDGCSTSEVDTGLTAAAALASS